MFHICFVCFRIDNGLSYKLKRLNGFNSKSCIVVFIFSTESCICNEILVSFQCGLSFSVGNETLAMKLQEIIL